VRVRARYLGTNPVWYEGGVERPGRFEEHRYLGDKRSQIVYDIDHLGEEDEAMIEELLASDQALCFAPDTLAEARNRGYRRWEGKR
jgi:hypothetical protein